MLYEMCTGTLPFRGDTSALIFNAILERPPLPAVRINPDTPAKLDEIIRKCLEKDRNLRYQHASDIRTDLQRLKRDAESGSAVALAEPSSRSTLFNRTKLLILTTLVAVLAGVGALYSTLWRPRVLDSIAVLPLANATSDPNADYLK
jgi:serine/threonine protein kinase